MAVDRTVSFSEETSVSKVTPYPTSTRRKMPPRDPVTGRFISFLEAEKRRIQQSEEASGREISRPASHSPDSDFSKSHPEDKDVQKSTEGSSKTQREQLRFLIQQWNENRLELFSLSMPDENDEFHGVMRFYYQEPGKKVVTKCVRVASTAKTPIVVEALIEKFRPDLLQATNFLHKFSIFEVHENGEERKLGMDEHPLIVQLTWHKDDREGRFLFRFNDQGSVVVGTKEIRSKFTDFGEVYIRLLDCKQKLAYLSSQCILMRARMKDKGNARQSLKDKKYRTIKEFKIIERTGLDFPPTTFTRTISNPEAVMKKRREQRLENKLKEMGHGGSLKIFGAELNPSKPYVTLLVGVNDRSYKVVKDTLDKYGLERVSADDYVLVEITVPRTGALSRSLSDLREVDSNATERYLHDDERPLMSFLDDTADIIFAVRKKPSYLKRPAYSHYHETASLSSAGTGSMYQQISPDYSMDPVLIPLDQHGREVPDRPIPLRNGITEVGSDPKGPQSIVIRDPHVRPKHCVVSFMDGVVAITPLDGLLEVNGVRVESTQMLRDGFVVRVGGQHSFRFRPGPSRGQQNYANSPIIPKNGNQIEKSVDSTMAPVTETTFGITDGFILRRTKSTDLNLKDTESTWIGLDLDEKDVTPRTIDRMLQPRMAPTHFPETSILNLPALVELYDQNVEDDFLRCLILDSTPDRFPFKLCPTFVIYMVARYRISAHLYRPGLAMEERKKHLQIFLDKVAERCFHVVHVNSHNKPVLAFWLANISEFVHILKSDQEVGALTGGNLIMKIQETVEKTYELLVETSRIGLQSAMTSFLKINLEDHLAARDALGQLDDLVRVIRKSRLNAALTIQLFSQLFYFINMYAFNWLVTTREGSLYLSKQFGIRLRERLQLINRWAEQQGLELAAECHLDRLQQTVNLLITPKTIDQIASLGATCYKLNSMQVRYLLENYVPEVGEPRASRDLIDHVAGLAQGQADVMAQQDGQRVQLDENPQLQLPFVFPQDGYIIETFHGIPADMSDFIASLQAKGICRLMPQIGATGSWTVHMQNSNSLLRPQTQQEYTSTNGSNGSGGIHNLNTNYPPSQASTYRASNSPPIVNISLRRLPGDSIGLSIVAAQGIGDANVGIYVKKVVENSAAYRDGRLEMGDQLLSVNGHSLVGISQEQAASRISQAGSDVHFEVSKKAAYYNGIIDSLENKTVPSTPSIPHQTNGYNSHNQSTQIQQEPPLYRHARSASASELFASQADTVSLASINQNSSTQIGAGKLPAHYKPANRPTVVQPQRPLQSTVPSPGPLRRGAASPTPLYTTPIPQQQRSASTVPFNSNQKKEPWLDNYCNLPSINERMSNGRNYPGDNSSPLPAPPKPQEAVFLQQSHFPPAPVKPVSGRSSAPLFDHPMRNYSLEAKNARYMTNEELDAELEAIEARGDQNTPSDIARYHELLQRIGELRPPLSQSRSTTDFSNLHKIQNERQTKSTTNGIGDQHRILKPAQPLPFMNEMASKLESKKMQQEKNGTTFSSVRPSSLTSSTERAIDDVTQQFERINSFQPEQPSTSALPRPAMRDNSLSPEDRSKKRVQFRDVEEAVKENGLPQSRDDPEPSEPRVQIVGNNEVYLNDPRQRRLNEIQQKSIKPQVDGAHLAFRDKMKMFATQIGESTPKDKQKVSSAQREIENSHEAL
ncbi:hypothetical protein FO519_001331 [Halicephalobus sp. NKZ332]|nr:hypothetical protein FO519_001331 [Halicephalobus sp. NKZ332]